jgi:hypothetical protein
MTKYQRKLEEAEKFVRDLLADRVPENVIKLVAKKVARATPTIARTTQQRVKKRA